MNAKHTSAPEPGATPTHRCADCGSAQANETGLMIALPGDGWAHLCPRCAANPARVQRVGLAALAGHTLAGVEVVFARAGASVPTTPAECDTALRVAEVEGWRPMTRECIAVAAGVSPGLVSARLGTMAAVRRQVMRAAVRQRVVTVVAEGLLFGDAHARRADAGLRQAAAEHVCR